MDISSPNLTLRSYQTDVIDELRAAVSHGEKHPLLVAPTGAGKTIIASEIIRSAVYLKRRVLFLAHRRELILQAREKLWNACRIDAGVIMAGFPLRPDEPVQIASVQTLWHRAHISSAIEEPPADLIIVDEAHRARARTYRRILASYPDATVIGLTATPCRGDGRGLGNIFDTIVECPSVAELIELGFLVKTTVYAPTTPNLSGVRVERGDYVEKQLGERMDVPKLIGDVVEHWHRLASSRKTVVFATSVGHSIHLRDEFRRSGVWAEHIDGTTPLDERAAILKQLSDGLVQVVCNCMVLTEGWDQPDVSCCILARPTKHMGLYRQMIGRVLRPAPGKSDALVLDHSGATFEHGFVEDPVEWTLDEDRRAENQTHTSRSQSKRLTLTTCPECRAVRGAGKPCTVCGWQPRSRAESPDIADGDLGRVERDGKVKSAAINEAKFYRQLAYIALEKGFKEGWAAHKFKEKFGHWPKTRNPIPEEPDPAVRSWVRSRQIAYAKAKKK